jgi:hypothetical protein
VSLTEPPALLLEALSDLEDQIERVLPPARPLGHVGPQTDAGKTDSIGFDVRMWTSARPGSRRTR